MKAVKRTKIRLETHEVKLIHFNRNTRFFCEDCQTEANHLTVPQAANMFSISEKTIFRLAEIELIHSTETTKGQLLICVDSAVNFENAK